MGTAKGTKTTSASDSCRLRGSFFKDTVFNEYRISGDFFDINLFTDEGSIPAHRIILSACSDFFKDKLRQMQPSWNPGDPLQCAPVMSAMYMYGVSQADLVDILEFIYTGGVQIALEHLDDFLLVAQRLKVKGLITNQEQAEKDYAREDFSTGLRFVKRGVKRPQNAPLPARKMVRSVKREAEEEPDPFNEDDIKEGLPVIVVSGGDHANTSEITEITVPVESEEEHDQIVEVQSEEILDDANVRFEIGNWHLEMDDNNEYEVELDDGTQNEVLVNGQKAKSYVSKIDRVFHCQLCDHSSKDKSNIVRHVKRRHTDPSHELCPNCGKTYKNKECLYNHLISKRCTRGVTYDPKDPRILEYLRYDENEKKWACVECGCKYRQKCNAREHVAVKHIGPEGFVAREDAAALEEPAVAKFIEFLPEKNKWKCLSCGRLFSTSFNVSHHIKQKHQRKQVQKKQQQPKQEQDALSDSD